MTTIKKTLTFIALGSAVITLSACGGGGSTPEQREMSQVEKASEFTKGLNYLGRKNGKDEYSSQYIVAKAISLSPNQTFAVLLDSYNQKYFAVDMSHYSGYGDAKEYLKTETINNKVFYSLVTQLDGTFQYIGADGKLGPKFSKEDMIDVTDKFSAQELAADVAAQRSVNTAARLNSLGLSKEVSMKVATEVTAIQSANGGELTIKDSAKLNEIAEKNVGVSLTEMVNAANGSFADQVKVASKVVASGAISSADAALEGAKEIARELGLIQ